MASVAAVSDREQQLAWEARQRPRAGVIAIIAGLIAPINQLWTGLALRDVPRGGLLSSIRQATEPGPIGDQPSLLAPAFEYYHDHAATFIGAAVVQGIGFLAIAWAITFLGAATRYRKPEMPRLVVYVGLVGGVLLAAAAILGGIGRTLAFSDFVNGPQTVDAARDLGKQPLLATATLIGELAPLALVAGVLLIALNAMRVGLLSKFLGVIGMIAGGLLILPPELFPFAPFVQAFWLISLGFIFLNFGRQGAPPAWRTGEAMPWPTRREMIEQQQARRQAAAPEAPEKPQGEPVPAGRGHPSSKKRKRKRRA
jgi:hypothetical protein